MWRPGLQMYLHLVKVLEDNYPEMMKRMFVVNGKLSIYLLIIQFLLSLIAEQLKNWKLIICEFHFYFHNFCSQHLGFSLFCGKYVGLS